MTESENSDFEERRKNDQLRRTLTLSQREAVSSAFMTATGDNFFNAFAVYVQASAMQISSLTAIPQFVGASLQLFSVFLVHYLERKKVIVVFAFFQAVVMFALALLATLVSFGFPAIRWLILLAVLYHVCMNVIQPHWRAWMGSLVPSHCRGVFFAARIRKTMIVSLAVFVLGGLFLTLSTHFGFTWLGFLCLFMVAGFGRVVSGFQLKAMHDPDPHPRMSDPKVIRTTLSHCREALSDRVFRQYSFFVAGLQAMVAISAPFFAVYMLDILQWTYLQFTLNNVSSIVVQFLTLGMWGRISDQYGNRLVLMITCLTIPVLPILWLFSDNFYYLLAVQALSGLCWSGFNLSSANYLYDIRPHRSNFTVYAALQSTIQALCVLMGAFFGGWVATHAEAIASYLPFQVAVPLMVVFVISASLRMLIGLWFVMTSEEPDLRQRPSMLKILFRVTRFNPISGTVLDWLTVVRKRPTAVEDTVEGESEKSP